MASWVFPWDSRHACFEKGGSEAKVVWHVADEVFGIGSPLKDVLPSDLQAVRMALGFISPSPFFLELLTNPCVLRRYLKEEPIKKYTAGRFGSYFYNHARRVLLEILFNPQFF